MADMEVAERAGRLAIRVLHGEDWRDAELRILDFKASVEAQPLMWLDFEGTPGQAQQTLTELAEHLPELHALDPARATEGGEQPPRRPPKAKAFQDVIFARAYWLAAPEAISKPQVFAQEVHVIAGPTFVISLRYPQQTWDVEGMKWSAASTESPAGGLDIERAQQGVVELRQRLARGGSDAFGLEGMAAVIDQIIDSVFDALNALRLRADALEQEVVDPRWLEERDGASATMAERILGMRRLLRQIRWAFLPADEISEFLSGPYLDLKDRGIRFRLDDLCREAGRAIETVRDVTEQVQQTVELANSMKTDRLNGTIHVLTVVATVLLVPTLIAGIYGMNFRELPGARLSIGFWGALVIMAVLGVGVWFAITWYLNHTGRLRARRRASREDRS